MLGTAKKNLAADQLSFVKVPQEDSNLQFARGFLACLKA